VVHGRPARHAVHGRLPGSGISYTTQHSWPRPQHPADSVDPTTAHGDFLRWLIMVIIVMTIIFVIVRVFIVGR
jgi:hypothetical protein